MSLHVWTIVLSGFVCYAIFLNFQWKHFAATMVRNHGNKVLFFYNWKQLISRRWKLKPSLPSMVKNHSPDSKVSLCLLAVQPDRDLRRSGKRKWGGLAMLANNWWCDQRHSTVECCHCFWHVMIALRLSYSSRLSQRPLQISCKPDCYRKSLLSTMTLGRYLDMSCNNL